MFLARSGALARACMGLPPDPRKSQKTRVPGEGRGPVLAAMQVERAVVYRVELQGYLAYKKTSTPLGPPWGRRVVRRTLTHPRDQFAWDRVSSLLINTPGSIVINNPSSRVTTLLIKSEVNQNLTLR